ncbi:SDR family oxidoreductase [Anaerocolumna jejuensis]|uniref:SDR family oxidoreductase n=1 Tax=Anaerocolumna jejuensis TaxID=259063 RepID=UPI003F7CAE95
MIDIQGRTAFITGGANGIGLGIARRLAHAGAKLALVDIDEVALAKAKVELQDITQVETFILDVRDRDAFLSTADAVECTLGPVTLLFNNAGVAGGDSVMKINYELWDWYLGINLYGVINGLQTFLPRMVKNGEGGHIVNTSSGAGLVATGAGVLYTTSKFAVVGLSEELRLSSELKAAGIGVSVLCPARVATDIINRSLEATPKSGVKLPDEVEKKIAENVALAGQMLHQYGVSIDVVGDMVLNAIQENALYIITDCEAEELIKTRSKALLDALPN